RAVQLVATLATAAVLVSAVKGDPILPDIWTAVNNSYDSDVMVTFADIVPGASIIVDELYDITEAKGALIILENGHTSKTNYYSATQQTYVVQDFKCAVGTLEEHGPYNIWGWIYDSENTDKDNFLDDWVMPYGHTMDGVNLKAPLQVKVSGMQSNPWNPDQPSFLQIVYYDYTDFKPYVSDERKREFLVHDGLDCPGRKPMDPNRITPPEVPDTFKVFMEVVKRSLADDGSENLNTTVFRSWMYYDKFRQLVRLDINPDMDADQHTKTYKSVHDYKTGECSLFYHRHPSTIVTRLPHTSAPPQPTPPLPPPTPPLPPPTPPLPPPTPPLLPPTLSQLPSSILPQPLLSSKANISLYFFTGIEYRIFLETGQCNMQALDPNQLGTMIGSDVIGSVIMANPSNFFYLDKLYVFSGYSETRGLFINKWTATRNDIKNLVTGKNYKKVVVDYEFLADTTVVDTGTKGLPVPVRIDVTVYNDSDTDSILYTHTLNLLHFVTDFEVFQLNPFDVRDCMDIPSQRTWIKLTFSGDWYHGAMQEPDLFRKMLLNRISSGSGSTYVRFPEIDLDHDTDSIYATMLVLEPAPFMLEFQQEPDRKPTVNDVQLSLTIQDTELCALQCLRYSIFICHSFYECSGLGRNCFVSNYKNSPGEFINIPKNCSHYSKAIIKHTKVQKTNAELMLWLQLMVDEGTFNIKVVYQDDQGHTKTAWYKATKVEEELMADDPILVDLVKDDYHKAYLKGKLKGSHTDQQLKKVSYDLCLATCEMERAFKCESFSYCYYDRSCYLSSYVVDIPVNTRDIILKTDCIIMTRKHTDDYSKLEGTVYLGKPKAKMVALDAGKCAFYCDNSTSFTCRSFDFCASNALVDFKKHPNQVLAGNRDRYVKEVSTTECAQVCENEPNFGCDGFDYCVEGGDITCFLTSAHYSDAGIVITNSPTCDHYSSDMAGLGCSMLVISIAFTFAGVYAYNKHYKV
ncbi:putative PAN domain-containing protein 6, partial [Homarus americanus]